MLGTELHKCLAQLLRYIAPFAISPHGTRLMNKLRAELDEADKASTWIDATRATDLMLTPAPVKLPATSALRRMVSRDPLLGPLLSAVMDDSVAVSVSNAQLPGLPLVMVNTSFEGLTGYTADEVIGLNCRFLQCPQSEPKAILAITEALREQRRCEVRITNRRKDGSLFVNLLSMQVITCLLLTVTCTLYIVHSL